MFLLDTSALIEVLHGTTLGEHVKRLIESTQVATTVFNKYELLRSVKSHELEQTRSFFEQIPVLPFELKSCEKSVQFYQTLATLGKMVNESDIFIAAICQEHDATLVTLDKDFLRIPKLRVQLIE